MGGRLPGIDAAEGAVDSHMDTEESEALDAYSRIVTGVAGRLLPSVAALQTEVSVLPIYRQMPNWLTSLQTLKEHSFDVTALFPVSQDPGLRVVEFDCVAVNSAFRRPDDPAR